MRTVGVLILATCALISGATSACRSEDPVLARLQSIARDLRELAERGKPDPEAHSDDRQLRSPSHAETTRYQRLRRWAWEVSRVADLHQFPRPPDPWPTPADAEALRRLLKHGDGAVRGLAAEALATLHDPADVPRVAALLEDQAFSAPALEDGPRTMRSDPWMIGPFSQDSPNFLRVWKSRRVAEDAHNALLVLTGQLGGEKFKSRASFDEWWVRNEGSRQRVWYWQERLQRELMEVICRPRAAFEAGPEFAALPPGSPRDVVNAAHSRWGARMRQMDAADLSASRAPVERELAKESAEVELKVRLFALNGNHVIRGDWDLRMPLLGPFRSERSSRTRLFELLEGRNPWPELDSDGAEERRQVLLTQLVGQADRFFDRADFPRLRALLPPYLIEGANVTAWVGLSRLLPAATAGNLDDPATQDGFLRAMFRGYQLATLRSAAATELVRIGLARNWRFLLGYCHEERETRPFLDLRMTMLKELGAEPLSEEKRRALAEWLLSPSFEELWTARRDHEQHRNAAARAVNAHAGREVLTMLHCHRLGLEGESAEALAEVQGIVRATLAVPTGEP